MYKFYNVHDACEHMCIVGRAACCGILQYIAACCGDAKSTQRVVRRRATPVGCERSSIGLTDAKHRLLY